MARAEWVTQRAAARLLGVHDSALPKMVRRGELTPRDEVPSLNRADVLRLARRREAAAADLERQRADREAAKGAPPSPPDAVHDWLLAPAAAAVLGCTEIALNGRATRGRVPYAVHDQRRWFRLDLLELLVRADVARDRRRP